MSSLSSGDLMRQFAQQIIAAQEAKKQTPAPPEPAAPQNDTAALATKLASAGVDPTQAVAPASPAAAPMEQQQNAYDTAAPPSFIPGGAAPVTPSPAAVAPAPAGPHPGVMTNQFVNQQMMAQHEMQQHDIAQAQLDQNLGEDRGLAKDLAVRGDAQARTNVAATNKSASDMIAAKAEQLKVDAQVEAAKDPFKAQEVEIYKQDVDAKKQLDDWHTTQLQQVMDRQNQFRDQMLQLSAEHPEDIWGNAATGGKIAGVIGIIGAGFAGQDVNQRVEQIVQSSIAAQTRKADYLNAANNQEMSIANTAETMFGSRDAAIKVMTANKLEIIAKQMDMAAGRFRNVKGQADLHTYAADLRAKATTMNIAASQTAMETQYKTLSGLIKIDEIKAQSLATRGARLSAGAYAQIPGRLGGISKEAQMKLAPIFGGGHTLIQGIDRVEQLARQIQDAEKHPGENWKKIATTLRARYAAEKDGLLAPWREYTHSGTKIETGEQKNFDSTIPTFLKSLTPESLTGEFDQLHEARDLIVNSLQNTGDAYGIGTSEFDRDFPLYRESVARIEARKNEGDSSRESQKQSAGDEIDNAAVAAKYKDEMSYRKDNPGFTAPDAPYGLH